jgi:pyruvate formate lyase activating enzyme
MDELGNIFSCPSRRELLGWGAAAAGCVLAGRRLLAQDEAAGTGGLPGPKLKGLARHQALFWEPRADRKVKCMLCPRGCEVADVERGYCGVRENQDGKYQTLVYGALCSANVDPIEKKPLFHYQPGTQAFSVATAGCNMECKFCQNWQISQFRPEQVESVLVDADRLVSASQAQKCPTIAYTYSEPIVSYEYMHDSAALARTRGVGSVMISNGYILKEPLVKLCRQLTGVKIDFKAFTEDFYRDSCAAELKPVLSTLTTLREIGIWFELVMLVIPTLNDSPDEIRKMSQWIVKELGPDVPVHFTRFHPTYRMTNLPQTPTSTLDACRQIAFDAGIHYAYAGNVPTHPGENTYCHSCHTELVRRVGYQVKSNEIKEGKCSKCGTAIPGVWTQEQALAFKPRA